MINHCQAALFGQAAAEGGEYLRLSLWSSDKTAPVGSGTVVEGLGTSIVVVTEG